MTEYLYWIDKEDRVLGRIDRDEAHSKNLLHRAGVVFVLNSKSEVALAKRSRKKIIFPGSTDSVCSFHVKYGQSYAEAAKKELSEETGIRIKPDYIGKFLLDEDPDHIMVAVFLVRHDGAIVLDPSEVESLKFHSLRETDSIIKNKTVTSWMKGAWKLFRETGRQIS